MSAEDEAFRGPVLVGVAGAEVFVSPRGGVVGAGVFVSTLGGGGDEVGLLDWY